MYPGYYIQCFEKIEWLFTENVLVLVLLATLFAGCGLWKGVGLNNTEAFPAGTYAFVRVWNSAALTEDWKAAKMQSERLLSLGNYLGKHYSYNFAGVTDRYIVTCHAGTLNMIHMARAQC